MTIRQTFRLSVRLSIGYLKSHGRLFLFSLFAGLVFIAAFPTLYSKFVQTPPTRLGVVGNYTISTLPESIQNELSFGLTKIAADGSATSSAASSWQATDSGKTLTFFLNNNLFWQDGTRFDSSQIDFNLKGVTITRPNQNMISLHLQEPFAPLPVILSQPLFKKGLIGLGQWRADNVNFNGRFISQISLLNTATGENKIYKFFPTESQAVEALKLGTINTVNDLSSPFNFRSDPHFQIKNQISHNLIVAAVFNLREDTFSDKSTRQALAYALPDNYNEGEKAYSAISPESWAFNPEVKKYPTNLDQAQKLLNANSGSKSAQLQINISTPQVLAPTAKILSSAWLQLGIKTSISITDIVPINFDIYLTYINLPTDPDQYALWHSTQTANLSGYKSPKVDKYLEDGRKTLDPNARKQIYEDFQRALSEDLPVIFLYYPTQYTITRN